MTAENHKNKPDEKKRKPEEVDRALPRTNEDLSSSESHGFPEFSKKNSLKIFDHEYLQEFKDFTMSGRIFHFIL